MKLKRGVNPDYFDFDEIDEDALPAMEDYMDGSISFSELRMLVGPESAENFRRHILENSESEDEEPDLFDMLGD